MDSKSGAVKMDPSHRIVAYNGRKLGRGAKPANFWYEGDCTEERGTVR